mgnify:CR=1 FL=1
MEQAPKWFLPVAITALLWNLIGCAAYLSDVMLTPDALAKMTAAQQAMHDARPAWSARPRSRSGVGRRDASA